MRDTCRVTKPGGQVWNPATLQYEPAPPVVVYEGRCKLRRASGIVAKHGAAVGQLYVEQGSTLHLPVAGSGGVGKDHDGVMLTSATDAALPGVRFRVEKAEAYANGTSRRFVVGGVQ